MLFLSRDFNARIKDRINIIPEDNLFYMFDETDYVNSSFDLQRNSKDSKLNSCGRALIELCCLFDIHVLNGRFNDITDTFTCFSGSGAIVVDYMIACAHLFKYITYFDVLERDESDHLPITCTMIFNINLIQPNHRDHNDTGFTYPKFKWNGDKCQTFTEKPNDLILQCTQNVHDLIDNDVNDAVNCITSLYQDAASCMRVYGNSSCTISQSGGMLNVIH